MVPTSLDNFVQMCADEGKIAQCCVLPVVSLSIHYEVWYVSSCFVLTKSTAAGPSTPMSSPSRINSLERLSHHIGKERKELARGEKGCI